MLSALLLILMTLLVDIVMLNALIAIMGDTCAAFHSIALGCALA